jgi:hypothetical protein
VSDPAWNEGTRFPSGPILRIVLVLGSTSCLYLGFWLRASALPFSDPFRYMISQLYSERNIAYPTCLLTKSFVVVKVVRFL